MALKKPNLQPETIAEKIDYSSLVLDNIPALVFFCDSNRKILKVSKNFAEFVGVSKEQIEGKYHTDLFIEEQQDSDGHVQLQIKTSAGPKWLKVSETPINDPNGKPIGSVSYALNYTDQKQFESIFKDLKGSETKYQLLVELMHQGISMIDSDHKFIYVNNTFANTLGYNREDFLGKAVTDFVDPENAKIVAKQLELRRLGKAEPYEIAWLTKKKEPVYVLMSPTALIDVNGNYYGSFAISTNISDRKKIEEELKKSKAELELKVGELERFYRLSIGRENKMVELKQQVKDLQTQLENLTQTKVTK